MGSYAVYQGLLLGAWGTLKRQRTFALFAILTAGIGIGAVTAVYSTMDWMLHQKSSGVIDPDSVVRISVPDLSATGASPRPDTTTYTFSQYNRVHDNQDVFADVTTFGKLLGVFSNDVRSSQVVLEYSAGNYFEMLGVHPQIGRLMNDADDRAGQAPVAVLSYRIWQTQFGKDPGVVGRMVILNGQQCQVIGVVSADFEGYGIDWNGPTDIWLPIHAMPLLGSTLLSGNQPFLPMLARLRPKMPIAEATGRAQSLLGHLEITQTASRRVILQPGDESRIPSALIYRSSNASCSCLSARSSFPGRSCGKSSPISTTTGG